jgi:hypothetical protein
LDVLGWKSNSIYVALTELMLIPDWDKILFSKSASPVQELFPSLSIVLLGAATLSTSPVDNTTPLAKGSWYWCL